MLGLTRAGDPDGSFAPVPAPSLRLLHLLFGVLRSRRAAVLLSSETARCDILQLGAEEAASACSEALRPPTVSSSNCELQPRLSCLVLHSIIACHRREKNGGRQDIGAFSCRWFILPYHMGSMLKESRSQEHQR